MKKNPVSFRNAFIYVGLLMAINTIVILLNLKINSERFLFLANVSAISLVFPYVILFLDKKEKFSLKRYGYFAALTFIALFIICNLFVYRII